METLLQIGASNAAAAVALGLLAVAASMAFRRPPLTRALWVVVLLKLVTPPIYTVHVPRPVLSRQPNSPGVVTETPMAPDRIAQAEPAPAEPAPPPPNVVETVVSQQPAAQAVAAVPHPKAIAKWDPIALLRRHWPLGVAAIWITGGIIYLVGIVMNVRRMRRLMRYAQPAPHDVQRRVDWLSSRLGLSREVPAYVVDAPVPPMLWALGVSPRLLLPAALWERLDDEQRDTVLGHELAHLRRGDHWVRALELLVCTLYWWHPIVWLARRELREATEQCCDAWVLWAMPRSAGSYAAALVEAIDFISVARPAVPALASGMGQFTNLRRRLLMIKRGTARRALTWPGAASVCGLAGLLLPLAPTFAQVSVAPAAGGPAPAPVAVESAPAQSQGESSSAPVPTSVTPAADNDGRQDELSKARAEVDRLRARLMIAEQRLAAMEGKGGGGGVAGNGLPAASGTAFSGAGVVGRGGGYARAGAARGSQEQRLDALEQQVRQILDELRQMRNQSHQSSGEAPRTPTSSINVP